MIQMTVADFKADFSSVLAQVQNGEEFQILYGRAKKPVAVLSPITGSATHKRTLGTYEGIASFSEQGDGKITMEEFLGEV
ncbi:MAG: prevent-host-death protein [Treponema sp.]|nr:prevent-host-death protein [Treponema sp.]